MDVFSFGVLLQVLWTCEEPYGELSELNTIQLCQRILAGLRPTVIVVVVVAEAVVVADVIVVVVVVQLPSDCPEALQRLMVRCWDENPNKRPAFDRIEEELNTQIQQHHLPTTTTTSTIRNLSDENLCSPLLKDAAEVC